MTTSCSSRRLAGWLVAATLLAPRLASGQLAELVADLRPGEVAAASGSVSNLVQAESQVFFTVNGQEGGTQIWATDGTILGTRQIAFVGYISGSGNPGLFNLGDRVVWSGVADVESEQGTAGVWAANGTSTQPSLLLSVTPEGAGLAQLTATSFDGDLFFTTVSASEGRGIWRTDGTAQGTRKVVSVGLHGQYDGGETLVRSGDRLLYYGRQGFERQLFTTDGTDEGTQLVALPGSEEGRSLEGLLSTETHAFIFTYSWTGNQLWRLPAGETTAAELVPGDGSAVLGHAATNRRHLYFWTASGELGTELWRTDGTEGGTRRITNLRDPEPRYSSWEPTTLVAVAGRVFFIAKEDYRESVWVTSGDPASTRKVLPDCTGSGSCLEISFDSPLLPVGNSVAFRVRGAFESEVMLSDGTEAGTRRLAELCGPGCQPSPTSLLRLDGRLYFAAASGVGLQEIWSTDGSIAGTRRLVTFPLSVERASDFSSRWLAKVPGGWVLTLRRNYYSGSSLWFFDNDGGNLRELIDLGSVPAWSDPHQITAVGGRVLFEATVPAAGGEVVRKLHASVAGESAVNALGDAPEGLVIAEANDLAYFVQPAYPHSELWRSDGTAAGTFSIWTSSEAGASSQFLPAVVEQDGATFFSRSTTADLGLWRTDGTAEGTERALALEPRTFRSVTDPAAGDGFLLFGTNDWFGEFAVWSFRPEAGPAQKLLAYQDSGGDSRAIRASLQLDETTIFFLCLAYNGGIWKTDGTFEGTERLLGGFGYCSEGEVSMERLGDLALLRSSSPYSSSVLVVSDGTVNGTIALRSDEPRGSTGERGVVVVGNLAYFVSRDAEAGRELWVTDGSEAGTARFADLWPGPGSSRPTWLTVAGNRLFFVANDGVHGFELWSTDGTEAGTRLVHDLSPGVASSRPAELTVAGGHLYFSADDGLNGRELWMLPLAGGTACRASERALCVQDGRFRVEAKWRDFRGREGAGKAVSLTADTGYFWFFNQENVEAVVKVLDGRGNNEHFWTFYGALSNVEYHLTVTDAQTGLSRRYANSSGTFASVGDTRSFGPLGASSEWSPETFEASVSAPPPTIESSAAAAGEPCVASPTRLCLNGGRFAVEASWRDFRGREGVGTAVSVSGDTGYFWFFDAANVETMVKVLDGRVSNGNFWVFYGALSNVDYDLTVTDTTTGQRKTYQNRNRAFASVGDTRAFAGS